MPPPPDTDDAPSHIWIGALGGALLIHAGMACLLVFSPAAAPLPPPEAVPMIIAMVEPAIEEPATPVPEPEQAEPPPPEPEAMAEPPPPEPPPPEPEPPPPEPEPPPPPPEPEPPPPEPEPPPPEPAPEPPPPEPAVEPLPEPPPPEPPPPQLQPPTPPRPRPPRPVQPRPVSTAPAAVAPSPAPPSPAPSARPAGPPASYLQSLAAALERQKRYPESARARRAMGVTMLQFTMTREGRVVRWSIVRSSGDNDLDQAVEAMIQRAALPPMPSAMEGDSLTITVPVRFQLR